MLSNGVLDLIRGKYHIIHLWTGERFGETFSHLCSVHRYIHTHSQAQREGGAARAVVQGPGLRNRPGA